MPEVCFNFSLGTEQIPRMNSSNLPSGAHVGLTQPQLSLDLSHYTEGEVLTTWNIQKGRFITLDVGLEGKKQQQNKCLDGSQKFILKGTTLNGFIQYRLSWQSQNCQIKHY